MNHTILRHKMTKYTTKYNNLSRLMVGGHKFDVGDNVIYKSKSYKGIPGMILYGKINKLLYNNNYEFIDRNTGNLLEINEPDIVLEKSEIIDHFLLGDLIIDKSKDLFGKIVEIISDDKYKIRYLNNTISDADKSNLLSFDDYLKEFYRLSQKYTIDYQLIRNKIHNYKYHLADAITNQTNNKSGIILGIEIDLFNDTKYKITSYSKDELEIDEKDILPYNIDITKISISRQNIVPYNRDLYKIGQSVLIHYKTGNIVNKFFGVILDHTYVEQPGPKVEFVYKVDLLNDTKRYHTVNEYNISPIIDLSDIKRSKNIKYNLFDIIYDSKSKKTGIIVSIKISVNIPTNNHIRYGILCIPSNEISSIPSYSPKEYLEYVESSRFLLVDQDNSTFVDKITPTPIISATEKYSVQKTHKYKKGSLVFNIKTGKKCKIIELYEKPGQYLIECNSGGYTVCLEDDLEAI